MNITPAQRTAIDKFTKELDTKYTLEQLLAAGEFWAKDSPTWRHIRQSGSGQIKLVCWYNTTHRPGSSEWMPAIIIQAALAHVGLPYSHPQLTTTHQPHATSYATH